MAVHAERPLHGLDVLFPEYRYESTHYPHASREAISNALGSAVVLLIDGQNKNY